MHPTPILATFSNISGRPKDILFHNRSEYLGTVVNDIVFVNIQNVYITNTMIFVSYFSNNKVNISAYMYNAFTPSVFFYGTKVNRIAPDVTPQNAASHLGPFCLLT